MSEPKVPSPVPPFPMPEERDLERLLDGAVGVFAIPAKRKWSREALAYLGHVAQAAHLVMSYDLGDEYDPAPVYRP